VREKSSGNPRESIIMSMHDDLQAEQPRKQGMSGTAKVLLVLGSIAGVGMLLCCGVIGFGLYKGQDIIKAIAESTSADPAVIKQRTQEVVVIDIPSEFTPMMMLGGRINGQGMVEFIYVNQANPNSMFLILESNLPSPPDQNPQQKRDAMLKGMKQGQQYSMNIEEESTQTRNYKINGEDVPFDFVKGKVNGVESRKIVGMFSGKDGVTILLMMITAETNYDEEKIDKMLKGIRLPGNATDASPAATAESDEPGESQEKTSEDKEEMEDDVEAKQESTSP